MKNLSAKWQKLIVWLTGYLNIIAFILAGGFIYFKTDDDDLKDTAKTVLFLTACFAGIDLVRSLIYNLMSLFNASYDALGVMTKIGTLFTIIKAIVFAVLFVLDLYGIRFTTTNNKQEKAEETIED